jgi:hypothetical protein
MKGTKPVVIDLLTCPEGRFPGAVQAPEERLPFAIFTQNSDF